MEIVKGNDIKVVWAITKLVNNISVPEDLSTASNIRFKVICSGTYIQVPDYSISGNEITFTIKGSAQRTGLYSFEVSYSKGYDARVVYKDAFIVVDLACQANYVKPDDIQVTTLEFYSCISSLYLWQLLDVEKSITDNSVKNSLDDFYLGYDAKSKTWYGKQIPPETFKLEDMWRELDATNEIIPKHHLDLTGLATEFYVQELNKYLQKQIDELARSGGSVNEDKVTEIVLRLLGRWFKEDESQDLYVVPKSIPKLDEDGNPVMDANGKPMYVETGRGLYTAGFLSAKGKQEGSGGGGTGGGLIQVVFGSKDLGGTFKDEDLNNTFNAYTINVINTKAVNATTLATEAKTLATTAKTAAESAATLANKAIEDAKTANEKAQQAIDIASKFNRFFTAINTSGGEISADDTTTAIESIRANYSLWTNGYLSAKGQQQGSGGSGGGLVSVMYRWDDLGGTFNDNNNDTFNAYTINRIYQLANIKLTTTGSGNAVTNITLGSGNLAVTKGETFATKAEFNTLNTRVTNFLEGTDTDDIINKWKELEAFLSGMKESDNLAAILATKADKSYVDSTFVTLATAQTISGAKTFTADLKTSNILPINNSTSSLGSDVLRWVSGYYNSFIQIGDVKLEYDSSRNAIRVIHKDGSTVVGLYSTGWLSTMGVQESGGAGNGTLAGLTDVTITNPTDKQVLVYDAATKQWINGTGGSDFDVTKMWTELKKSDAANVIDISHIPTSVLDTRYVNVTGDNMSGPLTFSQSSATSLQYIRFSMADNDYARLSAGGTATNAGWMEIATADDGTEPIYVRQYTGVFTTIARTATLLDGSGNTQFPGTVQANYFTCRNTTLCTNLNADLLDGYHESSFLRYRGATNTNGEGTLWSQIGIKQYHGVFPDNFNSAGIYGYGAVISLAGANSRLDIWCDHRSSELANEGIQFRTGWDSDKKPWRMILDSVNYTNYADGRYVNVSGDTMTGALNFANNLSNNIGDDCKFGDYNESGCVGFQGINGATGISLLQQGTSWNTSGNRYRMTWNGSNMTSSSTAQWNNLNADLLDGLHQNSFLRVGGENQLVTLTGGNGNTAGWRLVLQTSAMGGWNVNGMTLLINSRHQGTGIISLVFHTTNTDGTAYAGELRYYGSMTSMSSGTWRAFYNTNTKIFRLFWYYNDYSSCLVSILNRTGLTTSISNGTWYTSLPSDRGNELPTYYNVATQAHQLYTARTINGTSFNGTANITTSYWGTARTFYTNSHDSYRASAGVSVNGSGNVTLLLPNSIRCSDWFRSTGATGWYHESYGGGWYMTDSNYIRNYNSKRLRIQTDTYDTLQLVRTSNNAGSSIAFYNNGGTFKGQFGCTGNSWFSFDTGTATANQNVVEISPTGGLHSKAEITAKASGSDIRLKKDIQDYSAMSIINKFRSVKYHWNEVAKANSEVYNNDYDQYGLIAQDLLHGGFKHWVRDVFHDYYTITYERLIPVVWKGLQEVDDEVAKLKKEVVTLKRRIAVLEGKRSLSA